jgi:hypothetical protein
MNVRSPKPQASEKGNSISDCLLAVNNIAQLPSLSYQQQWAEGIQAADTKPEQFDNGLVSLSYLC